MISFSRPKFVASVVGLSLWAQVVPATAGLMASGPSAENERGMIVIYVDGSAPSASDKNAGDSATPLVTVGAALQNAAAILQTGKSVKILIHPGVYREGDLNLDATKWNQPAVDAKLVIEASKPGSVVLSGSEEITDPWKAGTNGTFTHAWRYDWGDTYSGVLKKTIPTGARLGLNVQAGESQVELAWASRTQQSNLTYKVERRMHDQDKWVTLDEGISEARFVDQNVKNNGWFEHWKYVYRVTESDASGTVTSRSAEFWATPIGPGYEASDYVKPIGRRRDMLIVNGTMLTQVIDRSALEPGSFWVEDGDLAEPSDGYVVVMPPTGVDLRHATIEAACHENILRMVGKGNVVLRGLEFRHAVGFEGFNGGPLIRGGGGVTIDGPGGNSNLLSSDVLIDRCVVTRNNGIGLSLHYLKNLTVLDSKINENGCGGIVGGRLVDVKMQNVETSRNNWRGGWAGFTGHSIAGVKLLETHGLQVAYHVSNENIAAGFWLDWNNRDITFTDCEFSRNREPGLYYEASQGPCVVSKTHIDGNRVNGILVAESRGLKLDHCSVADNGESQILLGGGTSARKVGDWQTGSVAAAISTGEMALSHCRLTGAGGSLPLRTDMDDGRIETFYKSLRAEDNQYGCSGNPGVLGIIRQGRRVPLSEWQKLTGQDLDSRFASP